ncbi:F-box protein [Quillaja saponaria]|uniref:F-box protein n=1 Tax=Quillaja saponaria TaxID=32244 RepID=A0AAD7LGA7_QUISA|nr:F-box protein [Quillaja saponaria]
MAAKVEGLRFKKPMTNQASNIDHDLQQKPTGIISIDQFPLDIILNIFSWVPTDSLARSKCVSKLWNTIIENYICDIKQGAEDHKMLLVDGFGRKSNTKIFLSKDGNRFDIVFSLEKNFADRNLYSLESVCNGLLCFTKKSDIRVLVLFNPLRQEALELPPSENIPTRSWNCKLGFDYLAREYKIVRIFFEVHENWKKRMPNLKMISAEVLTLGTSSWRSLGDQGISFKKSVFGRSICVKGTLYWLTISNVYSEIKIMYFDIGKEKLGLISLPVSAGSCHLADVGGLLGVFDCSASRDIDIWIMKDYDKKLWIKDQTIKIKPRNDEHVCARVLGTWENGYEFDTVHLLLQREPTSTFQVQVRKYKIYKALAFKRNFLMCNFSFLLSVYVVILNF